MDSLGTLNTDDRCEGAKFHSPNPLLVIEVPIVDPDWPGATTVGPTAWICRTCFDNLRVYRHLLGECDGQLAWPIRREFGNQIRALGDKGWQEHVGNSEAVSG